MTDSEGYISEPSGQEGNPALPDLRLARHLAKSLLENAKDVLLFNRDIECLDTIVVAATAAQNHRAIQKLLDYQVADRMASGTFDEDEFMWEAGQGTLYAVYRKRHREQFAEMLYDSLRYMPAFCEQIMSD